MNHLVASFGGWHFSVLFLYVRSTSVFFLQDSGGLKVFFTIRPLRKQLSWSKVKRLKYICCGEYVSLKGEAEFN